MDLSEYDLKCEDTKTISDWCTELNEHLKRYNKEAKQFKTKEKLNEKYKQLHKKWFIKKGFIVMLAASFVIIVAGIASIIKFNSSIPVLAILVGIINIEAILQVKKHIPPKYRISTDEELIYIDNCKKLSDIASYLLIFRNKLNYLLVMDKYKNAYKTLENISKEQNCSVEDLYNRYTED